jgi:hypothetical protein
MLEASHAETSIHFVTKETDPPSTRYLTAYCTDSDGTIRRTTVAEDLTGVEADELHIILTAHAAKSSCNEVFEGRMPLNGFPYRGERRLTQRKKSRRAGREDVIRRTTIEQVIVQPLSR